MIAQARLKEVLLYNPETGIFIWRQRRGCKAVGSEAGSTQPNKYVMICVDKQFKRAHQLAWLYMTGEEYPEHIDHINGDPSDNRWCNLRLATANQNGGNQCRSKNNSSGFKGVSWSKRKKKWLAQIQPNRTHYFLGYFNTPEEAHAAYCAAARKFFGEFARAV